MSNNVTPIRPDNSDVLTAEGREIAASYLRKTLETLKIYAAALRTSECEIGLAIGQRLEDTDEISNDLDVVREILEKGDCAIQLSGATFQGVPKS